MGSEGDRVSIEDLPEDLVEDDLAQRAEDPLADLYVEEEPS